MPADSVCIRLLDRDLVIEGPVDALRPLTTAYARFLVPHSDEPIATLQLDLEHQQLISDDRRWPLIDGIAPVEQLYPRFLELFYDALDDVALLHAGAVVPPGGDGAVLLAAPAGHGKSTLTRELAERGWTLLSDDFAPLDLNRATVRSFPRAIGVRPENNESADAEEVRLFGKRLVDPGYLKLAEITASYPLQHVFIIHGEPTTKRRMTLVIDGRDADRVQQELRDDRSAVWTEQGSTRRVELDASENSETLSQLATDPAVLYSSIEWSERPNFDQPTRCETMVRREAAAYLGREMLNRRPQGRLMRRYKGDTVALLLDLASALRQTNCWRFHPGSRSDNVAAIERIVR